MTGHLQLSTLRRADLDAARRSASLAPDASVVADFRARMDAVQADLSRVACPRLSAICQCPLDAGAGC